MDTAAAVQERYSAASKTMEVALCCPVTYQGKYLSVIPEEVVEKDYGCGDPTPYIKEGDVVVDLGSGTGKICFIASQIVGPKGKVIGVDRNQDMLAVARRNQPIVAERIGYNNVQFVNGNIEDLALDLDALVQWVQNHLSAPAMTSSHWKQKRPTAPRSTPNCNESVDAVVSIAYLILCPMRIDSNCCTRLYRIVRNGGLVSISDIVCDEDVPEDMKRDPDLWSGCISGAFREDLFVKAFAEAGFHGVRIVKRDAQPWQVVRNIEFRSVTVVAYKGKAGACLEGFHAVLYRGPWLRVTDDDGHTLVRGERMAVCAKTHALLTRDPYANDVVSIPPHYAVAADAMQPFPCDAGSVIRTAAETKAKRAGGVAAAASDAQPTAACAPGACCAPASAAAAAAAAAAAGGKPRCC